MLDPGTRIGPYRLDRLLGRGGMAVVYEATHAEHGRTVALKLVAPDLTDPGFAERFRNEGRMQAALDHPHVVGVYEAGGSEHGPYLAMRLVRGTTLAGLIDDGALGSARALDLLEQVAEALDAAHDAGLVHRDVKPRNVLIEDGDQAFLADFGLTRRRDADGVTATGNFMGTIAYAAPEVVTGETPGPAADRYALAAVLFECLTATPVFPRATQAAVLYAHSHEPPPRVSGRREGIPAALNEVMFAGLAKDPSRRPRRATELIARARKAMAGVELDPPAPRVLAGAAGDVTTAGRVTSTVEATPATPVSRRQLRGALLGAAVGLALGAGAVGLATSADGEGVGEPAPATALPPAPAPAGSVPIGSDLSRTGRTVDCRGQTVTASSPGCTLFQDRLDGSTLVIPRDGVIRRWGVRSASGEFALTIMRKRDDGYFQVGRSRTEFASDDGPHLFETDLAVDEGDRIGLVLIDGSGAGVMAAAQAATASFTPALAGTIQAQEAGAPGELLLRADLLPGAEPAVPEQVAGRAAARLAEGETLARRRGRFPDGSPFELRLVRLGRGGALDMFRRGTRAARITIPELRAPVGIVRRIDYFVYSDKRATVGVDLQFTRLESARLLRRFLEFRERRFVAF